MVGEIYLASEARHALLLFLFAALDLGSKGRYETKIRACCDPISWWQWFLLGVSLLEIVTGGKPWPEVLNPMMQRRAFAKNVRCNVLLAFACPLWASPQQQMRHSTACDTATQRTCSIQISASPDLCARSWQNVNLGNRSSCTSWQQFSKLHKLALKFLARSQFMITFDIGRVRDGGWGRANHDFVWFSDGEHLK